MRSINAIRFGVPVLMILVVALIAYEPIYSKIMESRLKDYLSISAEDPARLATILRFGKRTFTRDRLNEALWIEAYFGNVKSCSILIAAGADPKGTTGDQDTPIAAAVSNGKDNVAELLLSFGANPNHSKMGEPLLITAIRRFSDIAAQDSSLQAERSDMQVVTVLLKHGANPNILANGHTPLTIAAKKGNVELIKELLLARADPGIKNGDGLTPLAIAVKEKHEDCALLLNLNNKK